MAFLKVNEGDYFMQNDRGVALDVCGLIPSLFHVKYLDRVELKRSSDEW